MIPTFEAYIQDLDDLRKREYRLLYPLMEPLLEPLLNPDVSEIFVLSESDIRFRIRGTDYSHNGGFRTQDLEALIKQIGTFNHRRIGFEPEKKESPILEGSLPCGSRVSGVLRGINVDHHCLTIRKHNKSMLQPEDLIRFGSITEDALDFVRNEILENDSNILISGGTDTGKTTWLNTVANFLPNDRRILVCEDTPELKINKPHVVRFQTSPSAGVGFTHLLDLCMRQTGDHIIFGEIRAGQQIRGAMAGSPAYPFIMALNSGHRASMATIHANGRVESLEKFVDYCFFSGVSNVPGEMFAKMVGKAFQLVVQLRKRDGKKITESISRVVGFEPEGGFDLRDVFVFNKQLERVG